MATHDVLGGVTVKLHLSEEEMSYIQTLVRTDLMQWERPPSAIGDTRKSKAMVSMLRHILTEIEHS